MHFIPLDRMWERIDIASSESDTDYFQCLLYTGEMVCKLVTLGLVTSIEDSIDNHRYRLNYELVRGDGLGTWAKIVNEAIMGPPAQYTFEEARVERRELTEKKQEGSWQYQAVSLLHQCVNYVDNTVEPLPFKVDGRKWLELFVRLRNKTRGHGAITSEVSYKIAPLLHSSIRIFAENFSLFKRPWAYLHRNISGKYRVSRITPNSVGFDHLKSTKKVNVENGIYIIFDDQLCKVELMYSTVDLLNFYFANGSFSKSKYETLSYYDGDIKELDSSLYLKPVSELPRSETQSIKDLNVLGNVFTNMPIQPHDYIERHLLEEELYKVLMNDRHPIITLLGRGGIGKTSLSLNVLNHIADTDRFNLIVWLSARDIDLMQEGPKQVSPDVKNLREIAKEYWSIVDKLVVKEKTERQIELFAKELNDHSDYGPVLFIFDNFETVSNPAELYAFIDTYIRNPNKVLITTRHREFRGDYPIEVSGMNRDECGKLAINTANRFNISDIITDSFLESLYRDSEGHPYVVKIMVGERSKDKGVKSFERIITNRDDILEALFERTYSLLSEDAKRVFLTLCNWRSIVPQLALEAVILRSSSTRDYRISTAEAIDELSRISFIEVLQSEKDEQLFLSVPLVAEIFGKKKLAISPYKSIVEADSELLHYFGVSLKHEINNGIEPRIRKLFRNLYRQISTGKTELEDNIPMLEFIARQHPSAWVMIADLYENFNDDATKSVNIKDCLERYLENPSSEEEAVMVWDRIAELEEKNGEWMSYIHALVERSLFPNISLQELSESANRINQILRQNPLLFDSEEKHIIISKLAEIMESRIHDGSATDCSRLCWLYLNIEERGNAQRILEIGLVKDPYNEYCKRLRKNILQKQD